MLSGSAYIVEQGPYAGLEVKWYGKLCVFATDGELPQYGLSLESPYLGFIWETADLHGLKQRLTSESASSTGDKSVSSPCLPHLFY